MNETADASALPVDFEGSLDPARLPEVTLGNHTLIAAMEQSSPTSMVTKANSGRMSPVRGRTMKEYDQQISDLKKENFSLKMRIYYMEARMQQRFGDGQDVFKTNIELQVEVENLKKQLTDKQLMLQKAALAMETLTAKHEQEEESLKSHLLSDYKAEMDRLRGELEKANWDCEKFQKESEKAEEKLEALRRDLNNAKAELADSVKAGEELANRVKSTEFDVQTLTAQLKLSEQAKGDKDKENANLLQQLRDLEAHLMDARKQTSRQDRDIQDQMEDQKEDLEKKDKRIAELEGMMKDKEDALGKLEDALRDMDNERKKAEDALRNKDAELRQKSHLHENLKKSLDGMIKSLRDTQKECQSQKAKLEKAENEISGLQDALREAELEKTRALSHMTGQLTEAEDNNRRLQHQLTEANETAENLIKSLGRKEGELAGFQDQLKKAMEAMNRSEEAVEALQAQLKAERAEFDERLREQGRLFQDSLNKQPGHSNELDGLRKQIAELQKLIADQNVELLALAREKDAVKKLNDKLKEGDLNLELLADKHKRELSALERELQSLRAEVNSKDIKIQAMENHRVWVEDHQRETIHRFRESFSSMGNMDMPDFSVDLLQDIKMLLDLLRREMNSLSSLHAHLRVADKFRDGVNAEVLLTELSSVQRIYKQLEEGVEKNSQLHQALLNSLRGEHRQSDSPDSCQDGGYNLEPTHHTTEQTISESSSLKSGQPGPTQQRSGLPPTSSPYPLGFNNSSSIKESRLGSPVSEALKQHSGDAYTSPDLIDRSLQTSYSLWDGPRASASNQSVAIETCPEVIDRSLQTGSSFCHSDRWVQTSPGASEVGIGTEVGVARDRDDRARPFGSIQKDHTRFGGPVPQGHVNKGRVSFLDVHDDLAFPYSHGNHHDSLTDDAKEEHLGQYPESLEDYHNFQQGIFLDEDHFDTRRHDRASSIRADSRSITSTTNRTDTEHVTPPTTSNSSTCGSSGGGSGSDGAGGALPQYHHINNNNNISPKSRLAGVKKDVAHGSSFHHDDAFDVDKPDGNGYLPLSSVTASRDRAGGNFSERNQTDSNIYSDFTTTSDPRNRNQISANSEALRGKNSGLPAHFIGGGDSVDTHSHKGKIPSEARERDQLAFTVDEREQKKSVKEHDRGGLEENSRAEERREEEREREAEGETDEWFEERGERRSRRNSWADELEQYRVHGDKPGESDTKTKSAELSPGQVQQSQSSSHHPASQQQQQQQQQEEEESNSHPRQGLATANMSTTELRDLVAQLQLDLVEAVKQNQALQKQLLVSDKNEEGQTEAKEDTEDALPNGHHKSRDSGHTHARRSHIPRPRASSSGHSTTSLSTASEDSDGTVSQHRQQNGLPNDHSLRGQGHSKIARLRASSTDRTVSPNLHNKLSESYNQIQELEEKLQATENTVRLLSKKNKAYQSALESAGLSTSLMNRSNSENCLMSLTKSPSPRASSMGNLNTRGRNSPSRVSHLVSPRKDLNSSNRPSSPGTTGSIERARSYHPKNLSQSYGDACHSPPTAAMATSSTVTMTSSSPDSTTRDTETDASAVSSVTHLHHSSYPQFSNLPASMNGTTQMSNHINGIHNPKSSPLSQAYAHSPRTTNTNSNSNMDNSPDRNFNPGSNSPGRQGGQGGTPRSGSKFGQHGQHSQSPKSPRKQADHDQGQGHYQGQGRDQSQGQNSVRFNLDATVFDQSAYPDVTYSSMLDNTLMNRLLPSLEHNMSTIKEKSMNATDLSLDQLQVRLEHLERVNLTLREEIGIHEALHRSMGTQVSPSISEEFHDVGTGTDRGITDEDILRQHLIEIRKLRQRLERLDVTKDPEQLLIFQSHTQQRIVRQEMMISHLQQQMAEKEEKWQREMAEMQHRLTREKALLVEKLEHKISELQKIIETQTSTIEEQEREIQNLKSELSSKEDKEDEKKEELRKVLSEKAELEEDLVKRDKEFLDMEKTMFKLEMAKENYESEFRRMRSEVGEKEKENERLRKEVEENRESSKSLREIVVKRERSLQEKVYTLQKVTAEKTASDQKLAEREGQVNRLERELDDLRKENHQMRREAEERAGLYDQIDRLREELRRRESLESKLDFQKAGYEAEIERLTDEKVRMRKQVDTDNEEKIMMKHQVEELNRKLSEKTALERQVNSLKGEVQSLSGLKDEVELLNSKLERKAVVESELRERLKALSHLQSEVSSLRERLSRSEESVKTREEEMASMREASKEREEKLKKRDKQLQHSIGMIKKLDAAFTKQKFTVKEKQEQVESLKRQMHLYEVSLSCSSQEEKEDIMRELLRELAATKRQVEDLLSKLEQNSSVLKQPSVRVETYGLSSSSTTTGGVTTTVTTMTGGSDHSCDLPDTVLTFGVREDTPEGSVGELSPSDLEATPRPHSALTPLPINQLSPLRSASANRGPLSPFSPRQLKYYADSDYKLPTGTSFPQSSVGSDIRSLFAILKLDSHEKLRKETNEGLVVLSGVEARLNDRLKTYKSKSVSESMEYSTLRETSMSCQNLRVCLEEAARLIGTAWITELPPVDARGHFYDPALAEQNESLKREMTRLQSRYDVLDHTVKQQQGRLTATNERCKQWEASLYKQLHKTTQDLEQAKENIDTSLAGLPPPPRHQSFRHLSPLKSPHKRFSDTL